MLNTLHFLPFNFFIYIEYDIFFFFSVLGIIKIKLTSLQYLYFKDKLFFYINIHKNNGKIYKIFDKLIHLGINGVYLKYALLGIGYRQLSANNLLAYKLRYHHLIYRILPLEVFTLRKKKTFKFFFYTLISLNLNKVNNILDNILSFRVSNIFTKKGFFKQNKYLKFKLNKKKTI